MLHRPIVSSLWTGPTDAPRCLLVDGLLPLNHCALLQFVHQDTTCDDDIEEMPSWHFIFAKGGGFLTGKSFTPCIDNVPLMQASSPREAFKILFLAHFASTLPTQKRQVLSWSSLIGQLPMSVPERAQRLTIHVGNSTT
ncbi:uncharacterized protein LOC125756872 [Rhipicephalus sanguineus]|uniref:uncharacterized protein LOC125756872 n=1 Tax=Rhipicephalus sanguineus TaxID=34632 RepID=UPI0020C260D8|nr:uncharacterized protein LOC125756872 [Rhipicephalus sanguineus]